MKKIAVVCAAAILICLLFSAGCVNQDPIVGTWKGDGYTFDIGEQFVTIIDNSGSKTTLLWSKFLESDLEYMIYEQETEIVRYMVHREDSSLSVYHGRSSPILLKRV